MSINYHYCFIHRQGTFIHKQELCLFCNIKQVKTIRWTRRKERNQWHSNFKQNVRVSSSCSALHHWHQNTLCSLWLYKKKNMKQVSVLSAEIFLKLALNTLTLTLCVIGYGCLMLFPTIYQFYRGRQFYWDCNSSILKKINILPTVSKIYVILRHL